MLRVVIIGYGEMFTNLIAGTLDANCEIVGVLRNEMRKYSPFFRKIKDIINPSKDYNYIKSSNDLFLDRLDSMDHIIYGIINGKEKYKNKKKITKPVLLLEEIQDKQRIYLIKQQKREIKKRLQ